MKSLNILIFLFLISYILATDLTTVTCEDNTACTTADKNSECKTGHCACVTKYALSDDKEECLPLLTELDCTSADTVCTEVDANTACNSSKKCVCAQKYVMNDAKTQCLALLTELDCTSGVSVCTNVDANTQCSSNKCVCKENYIMNDAKTQCLQTLSSIDCTSDATVCGKADTNSECGSSKKCVCKSGYKLNSANTACEKEETPAAQSSCAFLSLSLFTLGLLF